MNRVGRARFGQETLEIIDRGWYINPVGERIEIGKHVAACVERTILYTPEGLAELNIEHKESNEKTRYEVNNETTLEAAVRVAGEVKQEPVLALNFASAKNAGGGFLGGAQAQEESLARSSALYESLMSQPAYYERNRACGTCLYTDHMILSPEVPVFRHDNGELRNEPYRVCILTAPAVNAGAIQRNETEKTNEIDRVMRRRMEYVLNVALHHQYGTLILGAWGCGVFRNDPDRIAELFSNLLLTDPRYRNQFRHVIFAVLDNDSEKIIGPFRERFGHR